MNGATPSSVRNALLQDENVDPSIVPSLKQVANRKRYLKGDKNLEDTVAYFVALEAERGLPEDPLGKGKDKMFVLYLDPQPKTFTLIFSTPSLLYNAVLQARATGQPLITSDGTFKVTIEDFPLNMVGTMTECHVWRLILLCLSAREDTETFTKMYDVLREHLYELFQFAYEEYGEVHTMQDGALSYPAAQRASFSVSIDPDHPPAKVNPLTCFTHVTRNLTKKNSVYAQIAAALHPTALDTLIHRVQQISDLPTKEMVVAALDRLPATMMSEGSEALFTAFDCNWGPDSGRGSYQLAASPLGFPRSNNAHESRNRTVKDQVTNFKLMTTSGFVKEAGRWIEGISRDMTMAPEEDTHERNPGDAVTVRTISGSAPYKEALDLVDILRLAVCITEVADDGGIKFIIPSQGNLQENMRKSVDIFRRGNYVTEELSLEQVGEVDRIARAQNDGALARWRGESGDGYTPRPEDTLDDLLRRAKEFYWLTPIPHPQRKCAQVAYHCTCSHYHMYQFCKHALALGVIKGDIELPNHVNPTAITSVRRRPGRPARVPPALCVLGDRDGQRTAAGTKRTAKAANMTTPPPVRSTNNAARHGRGILAEVHPNTPPTTTATQSASCTAEVSHRPPHMVPDMVVPTIFANGLQDVSSIARMQLALSYMLPSHPVTASDPTVTTSVVDALHAFSNGFGMPHGTQRADRGSNLAVQMHAWTLPDLNS